MDRRKINSGRPDGDGKEGLGAAAVVRCGPRVSGMAQTRMCSVVRGWNLEQPDCVLFFSVRAFG